MKPQARDAGESVMVSVIILSLSVMVSGYGRFGSYLWKINNWMILANSAAECSAVSPTTNWKAVYFATR